MAEKLLAPLRDKISLPNGELTPPWQKYFTALRRELDLISTEVIDDRVDELLVAGTNVTLVYNDVNNTLTIASAGGGGGIATTDDLTEGVTNLYFTDERVDDRVSNLLQNSSTITWVYNDASGLLTPSVVNNSSTQKVRVSKAGTLTGTRHQVNFIEGSNVTITTSDNAGSDRVDITISAQDSVDAASRIIIRDLVCDASITTGDWVRFNSTGEAVKAQADSMANARVLGLVESKSSSTLCSVLVSGISDLAFVGLDVSKDYYLDQATAGSITVTVPTSGVIAGVGRPVSSTSFFVRIEPRYARS